MHQACISTTSPELVVHLIESGCNPNLKDKYGYTPLHYACQYVKLDIIQALIKFSPAASTSSLSELTFTNNESPLHLLIQFSNQSNSALIEKLVYLILLNGGCKSLALANKSQSQTPFEIACDLGRLNIVEVILKFCAIQQTNVDQLELLASPNSQRYRLLNIISKYSVNSLHLASRNGHNDIIRLLLIYDVCDLNRLDVSNGCTALHEASRYGKYFTLNLI